MVNLKFLLFLCFVYVASLSNAFQEAKSGQSDRSRQFTKSNQKQHRDVKKRPVILIPGILGTQLLARLNRTHTPSSLCYKQADWFTIWLNLEEFWPKVVTCWVDNMRMIYHNKTDVRSNEGVQVVAPRFGFTDYIEYLDSDKYLPASPYFSPVVDFLVNKLGYEKGKNLFGAPYDWRLGVYQSGELMSNLTELVERAYELSGGEKVVLVAHSMGNLFVHHHLTSVVSSQWKDKHIRSFLSVSAPYLGALKALKALISGDSEGHPWVLPGLELREAFRTMPSSAMILPRPDLWPADKKQALTILKEKEGKNEEYSLDEYEEIFNVSSCKNCYQLWQDNGDVIGKLEAPQVETYCIYGTGIPTPEKLYYNAKDFPDGEPSGADYGEGDATVNVWSARACLAWSAHNKVHDVEMKGNEHVAILSNSTLHHIIQQALQAP